MSNKTKEDAASLLYERLQKMDGITNTGFDNIFRLDVSELKQLNDLHDDELISTFDYFNSSMYDSEPNYDVRFMRLAREYSTWSKDPKKQVGCVAVRDRQVISQGYNGFPRNIKDDWRLYVKHIKLSMVTHAEVNMIANACRNGVSLINSTVYVYGLPACSDCVKPLIQVGVKRIVMCDSTGGNSKSWSVHSDTFTVTRRLLEEAEINFNMIDLNMLGDA